MTKDDADAWKTVKSFFEANNMKLFTILNTLGRVPKDVLVKVMNCRRLLYDTNPKERNFAVFNSKGDFLNLIVLQGKSFKESLSLMEIGFVHIGEVGRTPSDEKQAIGRGLRQCSHKALQSNTGMDATSRYPPVRVFTYVNDSTRKEPQLENVGTPDPFPEFWKGIEETLKKVWNKRDELGSNYPKHAADRGGLDKGYSGDRQWFWKTRTKNVNDLIHELGYRETKPENVDEFIHSEERKEALATLKENIPFTTFVRLRSVFSTIDFTKTDFKEDDPLIQKMLRYNPKLLIDKAAILKEEIKKSKKEEIEPLQKSLDSLIKKIQSEQTQRMRIILRRQFESFEDYLGGKTSIEQAYENGKLQKL